MTTVAPSLLSCDFLNIQKELAQFENKENLWFHLDVMDGHFVPNTTFGHPIIKLISVATKAPLDAHFMVTNPEFYIDSLKDHGLHNFTFHIEASEKPIELIKKAKKFYPSVGISIKPKTDVRLLADEILSLVDLVLVMSVEPGFGGQSFIESTYDKINFLAPLKEQFSFAIQVDGGVTHNNSKKLIAHGVDNLVAGSAIFKGPSPDYIVNVNNLRF